MITLNVRFSDIRIDWVPDGNGQSQLPTGILESQGIAYAFIREDAIFKLEDEIPESCDYQMQTLPSGEIKIIIKSEHFNLYPERLEKMSKNIRQYIAYFAAREERGQWSFQFVQTGDSSSSNVAVDDDLNGAENLLIRLRVAAEVIKFPGKLSFARPLLSFNAAVSDPWERFCRDEDTAMQSLKVQSVDKSGSKVSKNFFQRLFGN